MSSQAQRIAVIAGLMWVCCTAIAGDIATDVRDCRNEVDDARRLRCYDAVAAKVNPSQSQGSAINPGRTENSAVVAKHDSSQSSATKPSPSRDEAQFGVSNGPIAAQQSKSQVGIKEIVATALTVTKRPRGELVVTLDNDQVWQQLEPAAMRLRAGDQVTIKAGALGSFILVAPSGRGSKVQRLK